MVDECVFIPWTDDIQDEIFILTLKVILERRRNIVWTRYLSELEFSLSHVDFLCCGRFCPASRIQFL